MEKRSTSEIADSIRTGSRYVYSDALSEKRPSCVKAYNPSKSEYAICDEYITAEDFFLLEMVYEMQFVTPELLFYRIRVGIDRKERGCVAISSSKICREMDSLKKRLEDLAGLGFLLGKDIMLKKDDINNGTRLEKIGRVYYISTEGFKSFTRRFEKTLPVPASLGSASLTENMRWLAVLRATYSFGSHTDCKGIYVNEALLTKKKRENLYGRVLFEHVGSTKKVNVIIEPIYFWHDETTIDAEEYQSNVLHRLSLLREVATDFDKDNSSKTFIVFLVENGAGLRRLQNLIGEVDEGFFVTNGFYTTESTIFESDAKGGNGLDSLLEMYYKGENNDIRFRQANIPLNITDDMEF